MNFFRAMTTVGGMTGLSRVAGFTRDVLMASVLGAGPAADAFFVALKLPNFFRRVTAEGAFSVSFIPVYTEILTKDGRVYADRFVMNMMGIMAGGLMLFSLLAMIFMPYVLYLVAPGFAGDAVRMGMAVELSRITFPYLCFMSLVALLGGVLNAHKRFAPFAFAPVLFNLCLIAALLLSDLFETAGHGLAWGVFLSGIVQLIWLGICAARSGFVFKVERPRFSEPVCRVFKLMGPGLMSAGVMQVNLFADLIMASFLGAGSISYLYYADRLYQLPLGMIGIATGTVLLPMLSEAISAKKQDEAQKLFMQAAGAGLVLAVPAAAALGVFAHLILPVLFERGAFSADDSFMAARVLQCYVLGLPAYVMIKAFSTVHSAAQDNMSPAKIAMMGAGANIALSILFIQFIGVFGIALATALTAWGQIFLHWRLVKRRGYEISLLAVMPFAVRLLVAVIVMICAAMGVQMMMGSVVSWAQLVGVVSVGVASFALTAYGIGLIKMQHIKEFLAK